MLLLPKPKCIQKYSGVFHISSRTKIIMDTSCGRNDLEVVLLLQREIEKAVGIKPSVTRGPQKEDRDCIYMKIGEGKPESYRLLVTPECVEVEGADADGLFYGVQTLRQIIRVNGASIPSVTIEDYPSFNYRGFLHDVTRGKVPTLDTLKELVDRLSFYKINQLQLYVEHSFAFKKHSEVWIGADPLTPEEILLLDEYCQKRHVELVPCLATFGHLYHALSSYTFGDLCELEDTADKPFSWIDRMRHHTLNVSNPRSIEFVKEMLDEFIPLFSSDKFNICCDETFDLGRGKSRKLAEKHGKGRLYLDFLKQIIEHVKKHGKQVMFWGDIILKYPEYLSEIPEDVICLNWNYSPDVEEKDIRTLFESGIQQYVCPGVAGWNRLMNDLDCAFSNISKMISYGRKYNAIGLLNTDWGDYGHINLFGSSMPGMIFGAALSWNAEHKEDIGIMDEKISRLEFGDKSGQLVGLLRRLGRQSIVSWGHIVVWKEGKLRSEPMWESAKDYFKKCSEQALRDAHRAALKIGEEILSLSTDIDGERKIDLQEFYIAARGIALFQALGLIIKKYELGQQVEKLIYSPVKLAELLEHWFVDYSRIWRARNRESELYRIREAIVQICRILRRYD